MKIIALLPVKDEEWILPTYISGLKGVVDEIIAINDGSSDNSKHILESAGATVYDNTEKVISGWAEHSIREKLLSLGREHGGTHFVCLDADETFSKSFRKHARKDISKLIPGQKMNIRWSTLYGGIEHERIDGVWNKLYKDFVFCDDGKESYKYAFLHVSRTPSVSEKIKPLKIDSGCVLHFQHFYLLRGQLKQAEVRCSELIKGDKSVEKINLMYSITLENKAKIKKIDKSEFEELILPKKEFSKKDNWHYKKILYWFDKYGIEFFEPLEIWNIKELCDMFVRKTGRKPKIKKFPDWLIKLNYIKNKIKNLL